MKKNNRMASAEEHERARRRLNIDGEDGIWGRTIVTLILNSDPRPLAALLRKEPAPIMAQKILAELLDPQEKIGFPTLKLDVSDRAMRKLKTWKKMIKIGRQIALDVAQHSKDPLVHDKVVEGAINEFEKELKSSKAYLHKCYRYYMDEIESFNRSVGDGPTGRPLAIKDLFS